MTQQPQDRAVREQALDPSQSFAVAAPAGSGKTALLTQRILKLLTLCERPEEILAITFTRKAAQEMQQRLLLALRNADQSDSIELEQNDHEQLTAALARQVLVRDRQLHWNLLLVPNRLRVQTIDSFCQTLVQLRPLSSDSSALAATTELPQRLYRQAVRELLSELQTPSITQDDLAKLLLHVDNNLDTLERLLTDLLARRGQWLGTLLASRNAKDFLETSLATIIAETLTTARDLLSPWWPDILELARYAAGNLDDSNTGLIALKNVESQLQCHIDDLPCWRALMQLLLTQSGSWRQTLTVKVGFPTATKKEEKIYRSAQKQRLLDIIQACSEDTAILPQLNDVVALPMPTIDDNQWQLLDSLTRLLPRLVARFNGVCERNGECDFAALTHAALAVLGDDDQPSDLALSFDYRIKHILVDEFQDTSLPQLQLLQKLTAGWQHGDDHTLFVVGDAMQSCYGFRDANVGIFMDARQHGIGAIELTPLDLTVNFRSDGHIVDWVNHTFQHAFPESNNVSRGAVTFSPAQAFFPATETASVGVLGFVREPEIDDEEWNAISHTVLEARHLANLVQQHLNVSPNASIAVLARTRSHLRDILTVLRAADMRWQAKDVDPLASRMAVIDLLSLTRALLDLSDRIAWLAILRAPWCGLDMHDLHTVANHPLGTLNPVLSPTGFPLIWQQLQHWRQLPLSSDGAGAVERIVEVLTATIAHRRRKPLRQWLEGTWLALGGPAAVSNTDELYSVGQFFDLLEQHTQGSHDVDWELLNEALAQLYDQRTEQSPLQVMTLHKAKGLEFDTVIIPALDRASRRDDNTLLLWQDYLDNAGHNHLLISPLQESGQAQDPLYNYLKREKNIRQQLEATRLLYIGCTRAVKHLYLSCGVCRDDKNGEWMPAGKQGLINTIWDAIKHTIDIVDDGNITQAPANTTDGLHYILRLPSTWTAPDFIIDDTLKPYRPQAFFAAAPTDDVQANELTVDSEFVIDTPQQRDARLVGTLLHQVLQQLTQDDYRQWDAQRIARQQQSWSLALQQWGVQISTATEAAAKIGAAIAAMLQDDSGRWLLDNSHQQSSCEMTLLNNSVDSFETAVHIIDRTFVADNTRWIIDYKSSEPASGQQLSDFLNQEQQLHAPQLQRYAELMATVDPHHPIKTALYFPFLQVLHEV